MRELEFSYEPPPIDVLTIEGVKYSGELFRLCGLGPVTDHVWRVVKTEDGVITIKIYSVDMAEFEAWHEDWSAQEQAVAEMNRR